MDENQNLTIKERREIKRQEKLQKKEVGQEEKTKNRMFLWIGVLVVLAAIIFGIVKMVKNTPTVVHDIPVAILDSVSSSDWIRGNKNASTTLIEYGDFECPACGAYYPSVKELELKYDKNAKFVFRNFPLSQHVNARLAARAAEAAGVQGKFFEMHDMLYENQGEWSGKSSAKSIFTGYASKLGLDPIQFKRDFESKDTGNKIEDDITTGNAYGVDSTPTFYLGNTKLSPRSFEEFKQLISNAISSKT